MSLDIFQETKDALCKHYDDMFAADIYDMAFRFAEQKIAPLNAAMHQENAFPIHLAKEMGDQGLLGLGIPMEYGGSGASMLSQIVSTQAISYHSASVALSMAVAACDLCTGRIVKHGNIAQKEKYLPSLASGDMIGALAMSEPNAGSDIISMTTKAVKQNDHYILNGEKTWITNGGIADVIVTYAMTGPRKLTTFLVDKDTKGFSAGQKMDKFGMRGSETYPLYFDDCIVPADNILGQIDRGQHILMDGLNTERIALAASALGLAENSLQTVIDYTGQRSQFGKPINQNQAVAFQLADMYSSVHMLRNYIYHLAASYDRDPSSLSNAAAASAFLQASTIGVNVTTESVKLAGGMGYTHDMQLAQNMADMMLYTIGGGTENIRRLVIARDILPK